MAGIAANWRLSCGRLLARAFSFAWMHVRRPLLTGICCVSSCVGSSAPHVAHPPSVPLLHLIRTVYIPGKGFDRCGDIWIDDQGVYTWEERDLWSGSGQVRQRAGTVPLQISEELNRCVRSGAVEVVGNVATYSYNIDNSMATPPPAVGHLLEWLERDGISKPE